MIEHPSSLQHALTVLQKYVEDIDSELEDLEMRGREATDAQEAQYAMAMEAVDAVKAVVAGNDAFRDAMLEVFPADVFGDTKWGLDPDVYHVDRGAILSMMDHHADPNALLEAIGHGRAAIHLHIELPANVMTMNIRSEDPELRMEPFARFQNGGLSEGYDRTESGIKVVRFDAT